MRDTLSSFAYAASWSVAVLLLAILSCSTNTDLVDTTPPAAVTDLNAVDSTATSVILRWTAPPDDGATGNAAQYDVRYATWPITDTYWNYSTQAPEEPKPKRAGQMDTLVVEGLLPETNYYFALKAADAEPNWSELSNVAQARTSAIPDTIPPSAVWDLAAVDPTDHTVTLAWTAPGDDQYTGTATQYDIRYSTSPITDISWASASQAAAEPGPKIAGEPETFVVADLASNSTYYFALKTADEQSNFSSLSNVANASTTTDYLWSPLGSGTNNIVNALTVFDGQLIAAGSFTTAGDVSAAHIASWNGSSWSPLGSGTDDAVLALTVYNGQLIAGGWFTTAGGAVANYIAAWNGGSWSALGSGMGLEDYLPYTLSLAPYSDQLVAGGNFTVASGVDARHVATWEGTSWAPLGGGTNTYVTSFAIYGDQLIAGGSFTEAGGVAANHIAAWNASSWAPLGLGTDFAVAALLVRANQLIAGGWLSTGGAGVANYITAWDGTSWSPLGSGLTNSSGPAIVYALTIYDGRLIVGGWFTAAGSTPASNIASWGE